MNDIKPANIYKNKLAENEKDKSIIEAAKRAIKNRVRQREPM